MAFLFMQCSLFKNTNSKKTTNMKTSLLFFLFSFYISIPLIAQQEKRIASAVRVSGKAIEIDGNDSDEAWLLAD